MLRLLIFSLILSATGLAAAQVAPPSPAQQSEDTNPAGAANPMPPSYAPSPPANATLTQNRPDRPIRISGGVMAGQILTKVNPVYPPEAKSKHLEGSVVLAARIGRDGRIVGLQVVSGVPVLSAAAMDAVRQWTYKVYRLNGAPVEVNTTVTVNFHLNAPAPAPEDSAAPQP